MKNCIINTSNYLSGAPTKSTLCPAAHELVCTSNRLELQKHYLVDAPTMPVCKYDVVHATHATTHALHARWRHTCKYATAITHMLRYVLFANMCDGTPMRKCIQYGKHAQICEIYAVCDTIHNIHPHNQKHNIRTDRNKNARIVHTTTMNVQKHATCECADMRNPRHARSYDQYVNMCSGAQIHERVNYVNRVQINSMCTICDLIQHMQICKECKFSQPQHIITYVYTTYAKHA